MLFGESLLCTNQTDLRGAVKDAGAKAIREDDRYWDDAESNADTLLSGHADFLVIERENGSKQ